MASTNGVVIRTLVGGKADVVADKQGNCGSCSAAHSCHAPNNIKKMTTTVINPVGAEPGDRVAITVSTSRLLKGLALVYFPPVIGLLTGAVIGANLKAAVSLTETGSALLFGSIGLAVGLGFVVAVAKLLGSRDAFTPVISRVIKKGVIDPIPDSPLQSPPPDCPHATA